MGASTPLASARAASGRQKPYHVSRPPLRRSLPSPSSGARSFRKNIMTSKSLKIAHFHPMSCPREGQQASNMRGAQRSNFCHDTILHTPRTDRRSTDNAERPAAPPGNRSHYLWHITPKVISSYSEGSQSESCLYHCLCYSMALPS